MAQEETLDMFVACAGWHCVVNADNIHRTKVKKARSE